MWVVKSPQFGPQQQFRRGVGELGCNARCGLVFGCLYWEVPDIAICQLNDNRPRIWRFAATDLYVGTLEDLSPLVRNGLGRFSRELATEFRGAGRWMMIG